MTVIAPHFKQAHAWTRSTITFEGVRDARGSWFRLTALSAAARSKLDHGASRPAGFRPFLGPPKHDLIDA